MTTDTPIRQPQHERKKKESWLHEGTTHWECPKGFNCDTCSHFNGCQSFPACASHTSPPAPDVKELFRKEIAKYKDEDPLFMAYVHGQEAGAKAAREQVLDELGTMLNSRIAKMEIICSKSKTPLREGILMAYREIEGWEMQQRKSLRAQQEPQP